MYELNDPLGDRRDHRAPFTRRAPELMGWHLVLIVIGSLATTWLALLVVLAVTRPETRLVSESVRLIPDTVRLVRRLAADRSVRGVRLRLWFLLVYLASPIDLVPDFIPVLGYADDVAITALVLRSVARRAGPQLLQRHWSGTPEAFAALARLCRLPFPTTAPIAASTPDPKQDSM